MPLSSPHAAPLPLTHQDQTKWELHPREAQQAWRDKPEWELQALHDGGCVKPLLLLIEVHCK